MVNNQMKNKKDQVVIYQTNDGSTVLEVNFTHETVWLTQAQMVEFFGKTKQNISLHINNIFKEGELDKVSVVKEYLITAADGKQYKTKLYNLDVIISVGYRVKSKRGTQFRIWATQRLREHLVQGYSINDTGLAALTLLVAESDPKQKEILIRLIMNMLAQKQEVSDE